MKVLPIAHRTGQGEERRMRIAILGAGNVGGALSKASVAAGHDVVISAANVEHAEEAARAAGCRAASSNAVAVEGAELVVLAVPYAAVADIVAELGKALSDKIVVDSTNPLNASFTDLVTTGTSGAEELQRQVTGAAVVKAFNTILASRHTDATQDGSPLDAFIAGDDVNAKGLVGELAASLGYRVIDAGGLRMARALEEMAFLNISLNAANGWPWQSAWKLVGPTSAG
jgi:NADPH-dependent F420 reductase